MKKLIIQIPCLNEAESLPGTLGALPHHADGWVVRQVSNTRVPGTTSGFRAFTREAALRTSILSDHSHALESIIQAGTRRMAIAHVPIQSNPKTRPSRLFESTFSHIKNAAATSVRVYTRYEPLRVLTYIGLGVFAAGTALSARFLYYCRRGDGAGQEARADASAEHR